MEAVVTRELAIKAILHGACEAPEVGTPISKLSTSELIWVENAGFITLEEIKKATGVSLPLWLCSGYGSGDGSGSGSGYGDGYGSGYGYGDGYGYGYGDGSGDGYGSGYGYGSGKDFAEILEEI